MKHPREQFSKEHPEKWGESHTERQLKYIDWLENKFISPAKEPVKIEDIHIGFEYEEYQMDSERYLNKGMIWVKKTYDFNSPRLRKMQILIDEGKIRRPQRTY